MTLPVDTPIRKRAYDWLSRVESSLTDTYQGTKVLRSDGMNSATYTQWTGNTQQFFIDHWKHRGDKTTGCNGFTGVYIRDGLKGPYAAGDFKMDTIAPKAWIPSSSGYEPGFGDVAVKANRGHVFVIMDIKPYKTIQGGFLGSGRRIAPGKTEDDPGVGFDTIGVGNGAFDPGELAGWLNIDLLVPPKPAVPQWALGWWRVDWDEDTYYYYFDPNWNVTWTEVKPRDALQLLVPKDGGRGTFTVDSSLNIKWVSGSREQFWYGNTGWPMEFWGKHNNEGVLRVRRFE